MGAGGPRKHALIVVDRPEGRLLLVRQVDHAAASAIIARRWPRPDGVTTATWDRFLQAVRRHDDGWIEEERHPRIDPTGRPVDFKSIRTPDHVAVWQRTLVALESEDPFAAVVVAQHARWLYTHVGQANVEDRRAAVAFVESLAHRISRGIARVRAGSAEDRAAVEPHALARFRALLSLFDRLSLSLTGGLPWIDATEAVAFGPCCTPMALQPTARGVGLAPWPFHGPAWRLQTHGMELPTNHFADDDGLEAAIRGATKVTLEDRLAPS